MTISYALLSQNITITGTTSIDSRWDVRITNITTKSSSSGIDDVSKSASGTTASFNVGFTSPGDYIEYNITIKNLGTLDAVVSKVRVNKGNNNAIKYTITGITRGDKLIKNTGEITFTIRVEYDSNVTSQPENTTSNLSVTVDYEQDLNQDMTIYQTYSIGDKITFAGSDWYVIKESYNDEDYVTLLKENVLTNAELG